MKQFMCQKREKNINEGAGEKVALREREWGERLRERKSCSRHRTEALRKKGFEGKVFEAKKRNASRITFQLGCTNAKTSWLFLFLPAVKTVLELVRPNELIMIRNTLKRLRHAEFSPTRSLLLAPSTRSLVRQKEGMEGTERYSRYLSRIVFLR